ncbi:uncharacterized protein LOC130951991 [Arachis stenosperma]|uniref:uncharacterized protein LOC130951991 n=1 Tax=Arachis stenosperma TaxID=217475 RepID=UPI0025AD64D5|nr:uncharacterized protein LOC130951991 [Arachis stenosperma]
MAHSDDDVLGLGNKALSGNKRKSRDDSSEEENEKEDKGFQVESPDNNNKKPRTDEEEQNQNPVEEFGCSPDVASQIMNHARFYVLLKRAPLVARDYSLMNEARNLIGQAQILAMNLDEYPDFLTEFPELAVGVPCVALFHGFQVLDWCVLNAGTTAENVAALGAPNN